MKIIKISMSNREEFFFPIEKAEAILNSNEQLVKITEDGVWTGQTINKAHIVYTRVDIDRTRDTEIKIGAPEIKKEPVDISKYTPDFIRQGKVKSLKEIIK